MQDVIIGREYPDKIIKFVREAHASIKILIYDWRWYGSEVGERIQIFNTELLKASRRGVDVQVLVNNNAFLSFLQDSKISVKQVNTKKTMHVKMIIIDNQYLIIGSHNLTKNAFERNHEISVLIDDQKAINRCAIFFNQLCLL
jgi:phosphatidylserine/phosphatidylglycerophosphate/cardiolipin synthase-like enzyme